MSPKWGPPLDWDAPLDGETTEEMIYEAEVRQIEDEMMARREQRLWEDFAGYYGRDGKLVITPRKITSSE